MRRILSRTSADLFGLPDDRPLVVIEAKRVVQCTPGPREESGETEEQRAPEKDKAQAVQRSGRWEGSILGGYVGQMPETNCIRASAGIRRARATLVQALRSRVS
jgi:hypothetical protein